MKSFGFLTSRGIRYRRLTMLDVQGHLEQSEGVKDPLFKIFLSLVESPRTPRVATLRGNPYVEENDASEWNEDSSRDKSPVMSRSIVLVTYRGTTATTIVKYWEFDQIARPRSITFVEILPLYRNVRNQSARPCVIDDDYYVAWNQF